MYDTIYRAVTGEARDRAVPRWAADRLGEVAAGRGRVLAVRHPLGFLCLPLERAGERGVCVHVWSDHVPHAGATTSTTHAHSWDLLSYVLYGTLRNELVAVTDEPDGPTHRVCEIESGGDGDEIRRTSRLVRRGGSVTEVHRKGDVYGLPAGVFHETVPVGETATVALGLGRPGAVDLALGDLHTESHRTKRQLCDHDETVYVAGMVVMRLAGSGQRPPGVQPPDPAWGPASRPPRPREDPCGHSTR
ncbi:MAG TPA: hypothetical protein VJT49_17105 [Amycolatopsis sp.]|uniref:hypothetical protein n=1 Tax=Amycolatopsis sp. TaxID=37632 RepID=UPI002B4A37D5|nr:hypothetical protein [Amycolatopsis sp.]HKS46792.1 hypothetical protein [Amycolatopsis sp.]